MNKETQESEAMGSEAAVLRAELEAAQAELRHFYHWLRNHKSYRQENEQLRARVAELERGFVQHSVALERKRNEIHSTRS